MKPPVIKMYAASREPKFEAFAVFAQNNRFHNFPFYKQLWRSEYDVGYTEGKGWSGGLKKPTPFIMLGVLEFDQKDYDKASKIDTSPTEGEYGRIEMVLEKFILDLIDGNYLKAKSKKKLTTAAFNDLKAASSILNLQKIAPVHPGITPSDIMYEVSILPAVFMRYWNKKALLENNPSDAGQYAEAATNQKKQEKIQKAAKDDPRTNTVKQKKTIQSTAPPQTVTMKKESSRKISKKVGKEVYDYYSVNYSLQGLKAYADLATKVLTDLDNRIRAYGIKLEKPLNLQLQIDRLVALQTDIGTVVRNALPAGASGKPKIPPSTMINFKFDMSFSLTDLKVGSHRHPGAPIAVFEPKDSKKTWEWQRLSAGAWKSEEEFAQSLRQDSLVNHRLFLNPTTNALIVHLKEIFAKYTVTANSPFKKPEDCEKFLRKYIYPMPYFTHSAVTKTIIEEFLIGDVRLLDDDFYKKTRPSKASINEMAKQNARAEVATQYEKIGDVLGDNFMMGKFENIDDIDDLYKSVLNHISIPHLIKMSAQCLMQLLGIDELKRQFCRSAIMKYRSYQDEIVDAVAKQGPQGQAIAAKLSAAMETLDKGLQDGVASAAAWGAKKIGESISVGNQLSTWQKKENLELFLVDLNEQWAAKRAQAARQDKPADDSFVSPNLDNKIARKAKRVQALEARITEQQEREKLLGKNKVPPNERHLLETYQAELSELTGEIDELEEASGAIQKQVDAYEFLINTFIPILATVNPFSEAPPGVALSQTNEVGAIERFLKLGDGGASSHRAITTFGPEVLTKYNDAKKTLGLTGYWTGLKKKERQKHFQNDLRPLCGLILAHIEKIDTGAMATFKKSFEMKGGKQAAEGVLDDLFNDPDDGLLICAAIFAIVPAALYALYYLISNAEEVAKKIGEDAEKVAEAAERRVEMFLQTDFPVLDILEGFKEALYDLAMNLVRDLIVNGIMYIMRSLMSACSDSEKANAPETPLGKIDLSEFMNASARSGSVKNSKGFIEISAATKLTLAEYKKLLADISAAFTINEMVALLRQTGSNRLHYKLLDLLKSLQYLQGTQFYEYYVNENGVYAFVEMLAKDIDPALLIAARNAYDRQRKIILNLCGATNEDIKKLELSKYMTPEELMKAMSDADANRRSLLNQALNNVGDILGGPMTPTQTCSDDDNDESKPSIDPYHESQKFASAQAANAIFGNLENVFEIEISRIKDIYRDLYGFIGEQGGISVVPPYNANRIAGPDSDDDEIEAMRIALLPTAERRNSGIAASRLQSAIISMLNPEDAAAKTAFFTASPDGKRIMFSFDPSALPDGMDIDRRIQFFYANTPFPAIAPLLQTTLTMQVGSYVFQDPQVSQFQYLLDSETGWDDEEAQKWGFAIAASVHQIWYGKNFVLMGIADQDSSCVRRWENAKLIVDASSVPGSPPSDTEKIRKAMHMHLDPKKQVEALNQSTQTYYNVTVDVPLDEYVPTATQISDFQESLPTLQTEYKQKFAACANKLAVNPASKWGSVLYPEDSTAVTGITYEDWPVMLEIYDQVKAWINTGPLDIEYFEGMGSPYSDTLWEAIRRKKIKEERWAKMNAVCLYLHNQSESWLPGAPSKAEVAAEAAAESAAALAEDAVAELDLYFPESNQANLVLSVLGAEGSSVYTYATEKPPVLEHFQSKYVSGSFYAGRRMSDSTNTHSINLEKFVRDNDLYMSALNDMFHDLLTSTSRNGLFLDVRQQQGQPINLNLQIFEKLRLTKAIPQTAAGECFLGFFNHKVLNAQVQNLTDALKCVNPMAVQKNATNLAYIKIALDCVVRSIVVKEVMKSLFIFGFANTEGQYATEMAKSVAGSPLKRQAFFDVYLFEEIERALQRQFKTVAGSGIDDFYTEIMEEFIRDISRIVYMDETMSTRTALDILIHEQVQYVKNMLFKGMPEELDNTPGYFDRRLVQQVAITDPGTKAGTTANETHLKLLDVIEKSDQLKVLQNEQLTSYLNGMGDAWEIDLTVPLEDGHGGAYALHTGTKSPYAEELGSFELEASELLDTVLDEGAFGGLWADIGDAMEAVADSTSKDLTEEGGVGLSAWHHEETMLFFDLIDETAGQTKTSNQFTFQRRHHEPMRNFSANPPTAIKTNDLEKALGGVNSGFVTEKLVELNYRQNFFTKLTEKQRNLLRNEFAMWESAAVSNQALPRKQVANFLNETKLILLFPQIRPLLHKDYTLIETNGSIESDRHYYTPLGSAWNYAQGGLAGGRWENAFEPLREHSLFWKVFRYNFDPDFTDDDKVALMKQYPEMEWAMTGKIYINDFETMVSQFLYPWRAGKGVDAAGVAHAPDLFRTHSTAWKFRDAYANGFTLSDIGSLLPRKQDIVGAVGMGTNILDPSFAAANANSETQALYTLLFQQYGDEALHSAQTDKDRSWWKYLSDEEKNKIESIPGLEHHTRVNFFTWFLSQPVNDILEIKFTTRVAQYVSEIDRPDIRDNFDASALGADLAGAVDEKSSAELAMFLLREKTGKVDLIDSRTTIDGGKPHRYVTFPVYTVQTQIAPDFQSNWFDFAYKIYKKNTQSAQETYKHPTWNDFFSEAKMKSIGIEKTDYEDFKNIYDTYSAANYKENPRGDVSFEWPWLFGVEWKWHDQRKDNDATGVHMDILNSVTRRGPYGYSDVIRKLDWPRGRQITRWAEKTKWREVAYSKTSGWGPAKSSSTADFHLAPSHDAGGHYDGGYRGYHRFTQWWWRHWLHIVDEGKLNNLCFFNDDVIRASANGAATGYDGSKSAKKEAIFKNMKTAYLAALGKTLYGKESFDFLKPHAVQIISYLQTLNINGLNGWIDEQLAMIEHVGAHGVSAAKIAPWYPGDGEGNEPGQTGYNGYDFTIHQHVYAKVVQDFLYQLSLNEFGEELMKVALPDFADPKANWGSADLCAKIRPGAQWETWKDLDDEEVTSLTAYNELQYIKKSDWSTTGTGGNAWDANVGGGADLLTWKSNTLAEFFGFQNAEGTLLDVLGNTRVYPYEYNAPAFDQIADIKDVLFDKNEIKKDIYTLTAKFADKKVGPEEFMGKMIEGAPCEKREFFTKLLQSFFVKEQSTILTLMFRILLEKYYPAVEYNFDGTTAAATETLLSAVAVATGDYQRTPAAGDGSPAFNIDLGAIGLGILKSFLGAMANTVDPFWKTPWIWKGGPGPFTPIGVAAKLLNGYNPNFSSAQDMRVEPPSCDHLVAGEAKQIKYGPLLLPPSTETPPEPPNETPPPTAEET